ncbi:hypothetical protein amb3644 [Paramagnetospirillum magneticum AMB-1]|uniref:Helix-turn-helix domain-containing protein n=1 Tax=Paramagnetospirillum magneticum (strain ATCC 700264 / AMB-1) TaxID=342108 RepID=Q2W127_PARM1|nr:hypothetical protein amb3644 [Paramagnetospirillum magneticum AMB-1]
MSNQANGIPTSGSLGPALVGRLYTLDEAAAQIHASVKAAALRAAIADGRLAARKIGRTLLIAGEDLNAYLEECRTCPAPAKAPGSDYSAPMIGTAPSLARGSGNTGGTFSGRKEGNGASVRRALTTAQRLKKGKPPSPPSSTNRTGADGQAAPVIPIK